MTYTEKLKSPKWQKKRLEILERDNFTCQKCEDTETTLHIHHIKYTSDEIWNEPDRNLITLCEHCHTEIEDIKKQAKDEDITFVFDEIDIYKSNNWTNEKRIMFTSFDGRLSMRIFEKDSSFMVGFDFFDDLDGLKNIITKALKFGE